MSRRRGATWPGCIIDWCFPRKASLEEVIGRGCATKTQRWMRIQRRKQQREIVMHKQVMHEHLVDNFPSSSLRGGHAEAMRVWWKPYRRLCAAPCRKEATVATVPPPSICTPPSRRGGATPM